MLGKLSDVVMYLAFAGFMLAAFQANSEKQSEGARIVLVPIGRIDAHLISWLQEKLPGILNLEVATGAQLAIPKDAYRAERSQYLGDEILSDLQSKFHPSFPLQRFIGLMDADCYASGLNFIFGQALPGGPVAFVALLRLRQSFYGEREDDELFRERVLKEVVHELGHTWNLPHCPNETCVMYFSNSLSDTDRKSSSFCAVCQKLLAANGALFHRN